MWLKKSTLEWIHKLQQSWILLGFAHSFPLPNKGAKQKFM
jgi:hypothetical protein